MFFLASVKDSAPCHIVEAARVAVPEAHLRHQVTPFLPKSALLSSLMLLLTTHRIKPTKRRPRKEAYSNVNSAVEVAAAFHYLPRNSANQKQIIRVSDISDASSVAVRSVRAQPIRQLYSPEVLWLCHFPRGLESVGPLRFILTTNFEPHASLIRGDSSSIMEGVD
jgi:hypothetical protein